MYLISSMRIISLIPSFWHLILPCLSILTKYAVRVYMNKHKTGIRGHVFVSLPAPYGIAIVINLKNLNLICGDDHITRIY